MSRWYGSKRLLVLFNSQNHRLSVQSSDPLMFAAGGIVRPLFTVSIGSAPMLDRTWWTDCSASALALSIYILPPKADVSALRLGSRATHNTLQIAECSEATSNRMWSAVTQHEELLLWESTRSERCGTVWALFSTRFCLKPPWWRRANQQQKAPAREKESRSPFKLLYDKDGRASMERCYMYLCAEVIYLKLFDILWPAILQRLQTERPLNGFIIYKDSFLFLITKSPEQFT